MFVQFNSKVATKYTTLPFPAQVTQSSSNLTVNCIWNIYKWVYSFLLIFLLQFWFQEDIDCVSRRHRLLYLLHNGFGWLLASYLNSLISNTVKIIPKSQYCCINGIALDRSLQPENLPLQPDNYILHVVRTQ
jgi:hypothetical protein